MNRINFNVLKIVIIYEISTCGVSRITFYFISSSKYKFKIKLYTYMRVCIQVNENVFGLV